MKNSRRDSGNEISFKSRKKQRTPIDSVTMRESRELKATPVADIVRAKIKACLENKPLGIVLTMKQNSVASKRMLKAYQERTELLKEINEMDRRQRDEEFRKWCELKEKELSVQQRLLALEEEKMMIERAKRFRTQ